MSGHGAPPSSSRVHRKGDLAREKTVSTDQVPDQRPTSTEVRPGGTATTNARTRGALPLPGQEVPDRVPVDSQGVQNLGHQDPRRSGDLQPSGDDQQDGASFSEGCNEVFGGQSSTSTRGAPGFSSRGGSGMRTGGIGGEEKENFSAGGGSEAPHPPQP